MRYYEEQQFQMLGSVAYILKKHKDKLVSKVPALKDLISDFAEKKEVLDKLSISRKNMIAVSSGQKKTIKEGLADALIALSDMLYAHHYREDGKETDATEDSNKKKQKVRFEYTLSELRRMSSPALCRVSEQLINASKKVKQLHLYGITEGDIKDAEAYFKEFVAAKDKPTQSKKEAAGRNRTLSKGIKECISLLDNRMDRLIRLATREDNALRNDYFSRRKVLGKIFGRPSDRESRYRKSRRKKIDALEVIRKYVRAYRKSKIPVTEAILFGTYAKKQAYSNSEIEVALIVNKYQTSGLANSTLVSAINRKFPNIIARYYSPETFNRDDAFINQIKRTGVKVE